MGGAWIQAALEERPNGQFDMNRVSTDVFFLRADAIEVNRGFKPLDEQGKTIGTTGKGPHLGVASFTPTLQIKGLSCRPSDLGLVLGLFGGVITSTPGGAGVTDPDLAGVPAGCTKHVVDWADDTPRTCQIIAKDAGGKYWKARGAATSKISFKVTDTSVDLDVSLEALFGAEIVNPNLTPSFDAMTPFRRGDMTVSWLAESADTKDFEVALETGLEVGRGWGVVSDYPDLMMFKNDDPGAAISGTITKRTMASADWDAMVAGDQFRAVIKLTHREEIGATGRASGVWIEMPGVQHVQENPDDIANVRRRETKFDWEARVDLATARLATITVVNATATYVTYPPE